MKLRLYGGGDTQVSVARHPSPCGTFDKLSLLTVYSFPPSWAVKTANDPNSQEDDNMHCQTERNLCQVTS